MIIILSKHLQLLQKNPAMNVLMDELNIIQNDHLLLPFIMTKLKKKLMKMAEMKIKNYIEI